METEYIGNSIATRELQLVRKHLFIFHFNKGRKITIKADNQKAISFAKEDRNATRAKHMDLFYYNIRNVIAKGYIDLGYILTA